MVQFHPLRQFQRSNNQQPMSTKKKPASTKDELAKGAEEIRKLAAKKKPATKKSPAKKDAPPAENNGTLSVIPSTEEIAALMKKHVIIAPDFTSLRIKDEIEIGEYIPIYDAVKEAHDTAADTAQKYQFVLGDLFNEGKRLFGKDFSVLMAKEGRPVSTLKKWGSIADNIDPALRNLHPALEWSHVAEVAKVPNELDKREILETAAKRAESGDVPTVKEIRKEADKRKPRRTKSKKKTPAVPPYEMDADERSLYDAFYGNACSLEGHVMAEKKRLKALLPKLTGADKKSMADTLEVFAELYSLLA